MTGQKWSETRGGPIIEVARNRGYTVLQISPKGVCHWVFWRHIYLYQIQAHILTMYDGNLDKLGVNF